MESSFAGFPFRRSGRRPSRAGHRRPCAAPPWSSFCRLHRCGQDGAQPDHLAPTRQPHSPVQFRRALAAHPQRIGRARQTMPSRRSLLLSLSDRALLDQCQMDRFRASGPGGQKRNKTDSAVRLRHAQSGLSAQASESRSQSQNRSMALRRLREQFALDLRESAVAGEAAMAELALLVAQGAPGAHAKRRHDANYLGGAGKVLDLMQHHRRLGLRLRPRYRRLDGLTVAAAVRRPPSPAARQRAALAVRTQATALGFRRSGSPCPRASLESAI